MIKNSALNIRCKNAFDFGGVVSTTIEQRNAVCGALLFRCGMSHFPIRNRGYGPFCEEKEKPRHRIAALQSWIGAWLVPTAAMTAVATAPATAIVPAPSATSATSAAPTAPTASAAERTSAAAGGVVVSFLAIEVWL